MHGQPAPTACDGHCESVCHQPPVPFNGHRDNSAAKRHPGTAHSGDSSDELLGAGDSTPAGGTKAGDFRPYAASLGV